MSLADRMSELRKGTDASDAKPKRKEPRTTPIQYVREVWEEMKKVTWPKRKVVISGTINVVLISALIAALLGGFDLVSKLGLEYILTETGVSEQAPETIITGEDSPTSDELNLEDLPFDILENDNGSLELPDLSTPPETPTEDQ